MQLLDTAGLIFGITLLVIRVTVICMAVHLANFDNSACRPSVMVM